MLDFAGEPRLRVGQRLARHDVVVLLLKFFLHVRRGDRFRHDGEELIDRQMDEPVTDAMMHELEEALEAGLEQLPLAQRAALQMKSSGHSLQEIAETLAITVSNAGVLIHRARQSLSRALAPYLEDTTK